MTRLSSYCGYHVAAKLRLENFHAILEAEAKMYFHYNFWMIGRNDFLINFRHHYLGSQNISGSSLSKK